MTVLTALSVSAILVAAVFADGGDYSSRGPGKNRGPVYERPSKDLGYGRTPGDRPESRFPFFKPGELFPGFGKGLSKSPGYGPAEPNKDSGYDRTSGYIPGGPSEDPGYGPGEPNKDSGYGRTSGYRPGGPKKDLGYGPGEINKEPGYGPGSKRPSKEPGYRPGGPKKGLGYDPIPSYRDGGPKKDSGYGPGRPPKNPGYGPGRSDKEFGRTPGYGSRGPSKDPGYGRRVPTKKPGNDRTPGYGPRRPSKDTDSGRRRPTKNPDNYRARPYKAPQFGSKGPGYVGPSVGYGPPQLLFPLNFGKKDLDDLDKIYFRLDAVLTQVKIYSEIVDTIAARLSLHKQFFDRGALVNRVGGLETEERQNNLIEQLFNQLYDLKEDVNDLDTHVDDLSKLNRQNIRRQEKAEILWARQRRFDVKQDRQISALGTQVKNFKSKLVQVSANYFETFKDTVELATVRLGSIKARENRRMCETGRVSPSPAARIEYSYQTRFDTVPQVLAGICGFTVQLNDNRGSSFADPYSPKPPTSLGGRVIAYSTKTALILQGLGFNFGSAHSSGADICFQACSIDPGPEGASGYGERVLFHDISPTLMSGIDYFNIQLNVNRGSSYAGPYSPRSETSLGGHVIAFFRKTTLTLQGFGLTFRSAARFGVDTMFPGVVSQSWVGGSL